MELGDPKHIQVTNTISPAGNQLDPSATGRLLRESEGTGLDLTPQALIVLAPGQKIQVFASGLIVDVDETIIQGSGEEIHDGPRGRFALAIQNILRGAGGHLDLEEWEQFRACTGKREIEVCRGMRDILERRYRVSVSAETLRDEANRVLTENRDEFFKRVRLVPNISPLIQTAQAKQIKAAYCSASSEIFVNSVLDYFKMLESFYGRISSAEKKVGDHLYSGNPVTQAAAQLELSVSACAVIGDGISDFAAGALAGVPLALLRLPAGCDGANMQKFLRHMEGFERNHGTITGTTVVLTHDYDQIELVGRLDQTRFIITSETPERSQIE